MNLIFFSADNISCSVDTFKEYDVSKNQNKDRCIPKPRVCFTGRERDFLKWTFNKLLFINSRRDDLFCSSLPQIPSDSSKVDSDRKL